MATDRASMALIGNYQINMPHSGMFYDTQILKKVKELYQ